MHTHEEPQLMNLADLATDHLPAITPEFGAVLAQAASVCLGDQGHSPGVLLEVNGDHEAAFALVFQYPTERVQRNWRDERRTTEHGALAVAFLLIRDMTPYTVIEQSYISTGFDYWLGHEEGLPFQNKARLEVSGIRSGTKSNVLARAREKLAQVSKSDCLGLPAYVVIVEFSKPTSHMAIK